MSPFDEVVVLRRLDGDHTVRTSRADRIEIVRRAHARGLNDIQAAELTGLSDQTFFRTRTDLGLPANADGGQHSRTKDAS